MNRNTLVGAVLLLSAFVPGGDALAADLININTADSATLQLLPGIGPSKAQAIIDYRTQHGTFTSIDQITNVSGIGAVTYNNIKSLITAGDTPQTQTTQTQTTQTSQTSSTTPPDTSQSQAPTQTQAYSSGPTVPLISAKLTTDSSAVVGAGTLFEGTTYSTSGQPLDGARYVWNFGDGTTAEGQHVWHTYEYPGTYDVVLSVAYNYSSATARAAVQAVAAGVSLVAEGDGSLTVVNNTDYDLNIGSWSLRQGSSLFVIPDNTMLLRGKGVRFAPSVLGFSGDQTAALYYQNGSKAAAAAVGAQSPLRGQTVDVSTPKSSASGYGDLPAAKSPEVASPSLRKPPSAKGSASGSGPTSTVNGNMAAAAGATDAGQWPYWLGLVGIIAIGAVGSYYAYIPAPKVETTDLADEFDIE